ncbi:autotransporter-associated beta strand protein [Silvimonas terrae]|uniref:Autotransporter-associated beta strand protein n=1 Tax=Silvimonas terrae TaxID=300266 RepID=A0A840REG1_9NEIS|nr:phosphatase PAP2 family protein [Silvimonas terrae]MBB5190908.1 autotransporter-associated beta strand protein [Silvimonas terrae]
MNNNRYAPPAALLPVALAITLALAACGGGSSDSTTTSSPTALTVPAAPAGLGAVDTAPVQDEASILPFVDYAYTNQRGDARYATDATNAGVRVLDGYLALWTPSTLIVDAGVTAAANGSFPAVVASNWTGIPGDSTDGAIVNATILNANIQYVIGATNNRTADQATAAYLDDRRQKGYSVTDGMGPLTSAWRTATQQTTTITSVASDATTVLYNDTGNNIGVGSSAGNTTFGAAVDLISSVGNNASTEPAKRFYKYARPWRWSSSVVVVPALVPAESTTPNVDGGFPSGHAAEAGRDALAMAYLVPERFQELATRALELGENRILAGMHSPLDVMGGRIQSEALVAANLVAATTATRQTAVTQAHTALMAATNTTTLAAFNQFAHSGTTSTDRFADHAANKANYLRRLTYSFPQIADTTKTAQVPKDAEILLETRLPYLSADQRRVVLKTTAVASGYPIMDDKEGWGRLNLFAAADGYGAFNGDVSVSMDATQGGFNALDYWQNDIAGKGKFSLSGTGTLVFNGNNSYTGGTEIDGGTLQANSATGFGNGDVYVAGGTAVFNASSAVTTVNYTQLASGTTQANLGNNGQGQLKASGTVTLAGGTLNVKFASGFTPTVGSTLTVITAGKLQGTFSSVNVAGFKATPVYTSTGMQILITG